MDDDTRFPSDAPLFGASGCGPPPARGRLSLAGTGEAARTLVALLPLVHNVLRRAGVPDKDVPDVAHEVLLSVLVCLARQPPSEPVPGADAWPSYLCVAAARRAGQFRRRGARCGLRLGVDPDHDVSGEPSPEEWLFAAELADALDPARTTTPERWRALYAFAVAGMPVAQIAEAEHAPSRVIYARIAQARRDFRAVLKRLR